MEDLKKYLPDDASDDDRRALEKIEQGFDALRLEKKVVAAAIARRELARRRFWKKWIATALGLFLLGALAFLFLSKFSEKDDAPPADAPTKFEEKIDPQTEQPHQFPPTQSIENQTPEPKIPPKTQSQKSKPEPIAEHPKTEGEKKYDRQIAPTIRGENQADPARQALLDKIWRTEYPPAGMDFGEKFSEIDKLLRARAFSGAYVRMQRLERSLSANNDTLIFMKGFCLLEMGEGVAALQNFENLEARLPATAVHLDWFRGLCFVLTNRRAEALTVFQKIEKTSAHPFREDARRAVGLLE